MNFRSILNSTFVLAMALSLVCSVSTQPSYAGGPIAATAYDIVPLEVGASAPTFEVLAADGTPFRFEAGSRERPVMLLAFRGGWCPYCNVYLSEMRHVVPKLKAMGVDVLFLSGDRPDILISGLSDEAQDDIAGLDYTILSDANAEAAIAFGTAFAVPDKRRATMQSRKYDIAGSSTELHHVLPVPSVFAVDKNGIIQFAYTNPDYKTRLPADDLLAVAAEITAAD